VTYAIIGDTLAGARVESCTVEPLPGPLAGTRVTPLSGMRIRTAGGGEVVGLLVAIEESAFVPSRRAVVYYDRGERCLRVLYVEVRP